MLYLLPFSMNGYILTLIGVILSFALTVILTAALRPLLPADIGRAYAVNAQAAKGKPRGAGIIFVTAACAMLLVFTRLSTESLIYTVLILAAMLSGFLDDASKAPWSEYKKGHPRLVFLNFFSLFWNNKDIFIINKL